MSSPTASVRTLPERITRRDADPVPPPAPPAQKGVAAVGVAIAAVLVATTLTSQGWREAALLLLGTGLGFALFHARFGFTSAWRQLVAVGQGKALRAHTVLLGATAILFAPFLASGVSPTGVDVSGYVSPLGIGLVFGAVVFGLGMQIGGACASGTLYAVGSGHTSILLTLFGFVVGATVGAAHLGWWQGLPGTQDPVSFAEVFGGYAGGLAVTLALLGLVVAATYVVGKRRNPPPVAPVATAGGVARVLRGSWPLWVGALALAVLNLGVLLVSGSPWGVTTAFALWGSKAAGALGIAEPSTWDFWASRSATLEGSVLAETTSLTNFGIMVGALIASALAGAFTLHRRIPLKLAAGAIIGGILMGYGARLAYGCNIGAYLGGISSQSLHGWVWGLAALAGTWFGIRLRPFFGLSRPVSSDSVC